MSSLALASRAAALGGIGTLMATGASTATATLYQTNTSLAVFNLSSTPFGSGNSDSLVLASVPISSTGTAVAGNANTLILRNRNAATVATFTVSGVGGGGDIVVPSIAITAALTQTLNALVLRMAASGLLTVEASFTLI